MPISQEAKLEGKNATIIISSVISWDYACSLRRILPLPLLRATYARRSLMPTYVREAFSSSKSQQWECDGWWGWML